MRERGLTPAEIQGLADLARLPFSTKSDLRDTYPFGLFASPMEEIVRLHASSGTTGKPIVVAYTQSDVDVWTSVMARSFAACGLHAGDVVQNAYGYGLFTGGLGAHYGAEGLGATVIPISGGNTDRQIMVMKDFGVTAICCTPSYFLHLMERAAELGVDIRELPLRAGVFGAEPWTGAMRAPHRSRRRDSRFRYLRTQRDHRPGRCRRVRGTKRAAHFRGPLLSRDRRPRHWRCASGRRRGRTCADDFEQARDAHDPLSHARHHRAVARQMPLRPHPSPHAPHQPPQRRHDDHPRSERVPCAGGSGALEVEGTLPHYQIVLTRDHGLDQMEVQVEVTPETFSATRLALWRN